MPDQKYDLVVNETFPIPYVSDVCFVFRTESPDPDWFDESQATVFDKLQADERFLDSFRRSMGYVKLLAELDLLKVKG